MIAGFTIKNNVVRLLVTVVLLLCFAIQVTAQDKETVRVFKVKDNQMLIILSKDVSFGAVDTFVIKYNLRDIGLARFIRTGNKDSLIRMGWTIAMEGKKYVISKPLGAVTPTPYPAGKAIFTPVPTPDNWREVGGNRTTYGYNRFSKGQEFRRDKNLVFFHLKGFDDAKRVRLAGNFTNWQHAAFPMTRMGDGWTVQVKLEPGLYYYKFIVNDNHWITDPANDLAESDGRGNMNSVYFVPNNKFLLKNHDDAHRVYLSGTFNNWATDDIVMKKNGEGWFVEMFIEEGTYSYQYIVDGKIVRPDGTEVQKLAIGKPHTFKLKAFPNAQKVMLAGNFNNWNPEELRMKKTNDGWELPYALGAGNYQYKFIVDGSWMVDPSNPVVVSDEHGNQNSFMVIGANYTFRLPGQPGARKVYITGDFTDYSPVGIPMEKVNDVWEARVYLAKGKHRYSFIVDGAQMRDPFNKAWEFDDQRVRRSVLWIDPNEPAQAAR